MPIDAQQSEQSILQSLRLAASGCRGCPLYQDATQTVFGEGPYDARLVIVGGQPGHDDDLIGRPFCGPSGRLLDELLEEAGLRRDDIYFTNAVKHFKFEYQGTVRLHQRPEGSEVQACVAWLEAELEVIRPRVLLLLGTIAVRALFGEEFRLEEHRGQKLASPWCRRTLVTLHPLFVLQQRLPEQRELARRELLRDLRTAAELAVRRPS